MKPAKTETEAAISQRMVAAGLRVLEESGRLEGQMSSDALLVRRIFRAMRAAEARRRQKTVWMWDCLISTEATKPP